MIVRLSHDFMRNYHFLHLAQSFELLFQPILELGNYFEKCRGNGSFYRQKAAERF